MDQSLDNPYFLPVLRESLDFADVSFSDGYIDASEVNMLHTLKEEERLEARIKTPLHNTSASACVALGLLIEDTQYVDRF